MFDWLQHPALDRGVTLLLGLWIVAGTFFLHREVRKLKKEITALVNPKITISTAPVKNAFEERAGMRYGVPPTFGIVPAPTTTGSTAAIRAED